MVLASLSTRINVIALLHWKDLRIGYDMKLKNVNVVVEFRCENNKGWTIRYSENKDEAS